MKGREEKRMYLEDDVSSSGLLQVSPVWKLEAQRASVVFFHFSPSPSR